MKIENQKITLLSSEYLVEPSYADSKKYKVLYDGKDITNTVLGIIRRRDIN